MTALDSSIAYTESAGERKNDGDKINAILMDEQGKLSPKMNIDVNERWAVNQLSLSTGGGSIIWGWADGPSTVEEMNDGGLQYYKMCQQADFYKRLSDKGQTFNGLAVCFFSNYIGMEGYIDRFGMSVIDKPTDRQIALRPDANFAKLRKGAKQVLQEEMDALLKSGTPADLERYRSLRRKQPMCYADCWRSGSGDNGFDMESIEARLAELRRLDALLQSQIIRGFFRWEGDKVVWITDPEGRFEMVKKLPKEVTSQKIKVPIYISFTATPIPATAFSP